MLQRLIRVTQSRLPFSKEVERFRQQRQWLIELEHLLDPERKSPKRGCDVAQAVDNYLTALTTNTSFDGQDQCCVQHINQTFRSFWWGLFVCYDVAGLPRTNNQLERFILQVKMGHRRISGRKNVHDFVLRYGAYATLIDYSESEADLLARLALVSQDDFLRERDILKLSLLQDVKIHRFRFHRSQFLTDLEARWEAAVSRSQPLVVR